MKRTLTSIILVLVLAAFMACGYFVSPIFIDMLVLIFLAGSLYEMFHCLKGAGYNMFAAPPIFVLVTLYPVFYLMQYYIGGGINSVSAGIQGILIVLLAGALMCLTIFTFKPASKRVSPGNTSESGETIESCEAKKSYEAQEDIAEAGSAYIAAVSVEGGSSCENSSNQCKKTVKMTASLNDLFANIFLIVYPTMFFSAAFIISYKYSAFFAVLFAILVPIIGSDMFAFFFGKAIGGKKLCPSISPKKTVAGAIGGIIGGMTVAILLWVIFEYVGGELAPKFIEKCAYTPFIPHSEGGLWKSALIYLALGAILAVISELGDLAASRIKRSIGIKDYGKIFPGHGGFLDRIDSVMYGLVVLLVALVCIYGY